MGKLLVNPFDLDEDTEDLQDNPRRRRRRRSSRRKARSSRRKSRRRGRRSNPFAAAAPKRRRRSGRRRRSSGRRRSNPMRLPGVLSGGIVKKSIGLVGGFIGGGFIGSVLMSKLPLPDSIKGNQGYREILGGILGGFLLKKFGGPLRSFAGDFVAGAIAHGIYLQPFMPTGSGLAARAGLSGFALGSSDVAYGMALAGQPNLYGLGDYVTGNLSYS